MDNIDRRLLADMDPKFISTLVDRTQNFEIPQPKPANEEFFTQAMEELNPLWTSKVADGHDEVSFRRVYRDHWPGGLLNGEL